MTNIRQLSAGASLSESNIKHLQDSRKQQKKRERERGMNQERRGEECDEGSGGGDCIACLQGASGNFN